MHVCICKHATLAPLIQGYFCDGTRQNTVSQNDASQNGVLEPFSSGINITNTLSSNFGSLHALELVFFTKIALVIITHIYKFVCKWDNMEKETAVKDQRSIKTVSEKSSLPSV
jgi:hypothetical protein